MVIDWISLGRSIALAFFGHDMKELRPFQVTHVLQCFDQLFDIMAVYRADVIKAQLLKQGAGNNHALEVFFGSPDQLFDRRRSGQDLLAAFADRGIEAARQQLCQVVVQCTDIFRNGHLVVIEDHQHVRMYVTGMVHRLKSHPGGDRAVADHADHLAAELFFSGGNRHAEAGTDRGGGVADGQHVVLALFTPRERVKPIFLTDRRHRLTAAGQDFMRVCLMAYIPDQVIERGIVDIVQGNGQLDGTEAGGKVTAGLAY